MTVAAISIFLVSYQSAFLRAKIQIKSNITKKQKNFFEKSERRKTKDEKRKTIDG
jgi:hypothetical protein